MSFHKIWFYKVDKRIWAVIRGIKKSLYCVLICITKPSLFKYIENFTTKSLKFSNKYSDIIHISD